MQISNLTLPRVAFTAGMLLAMAIGTLSAADRPTIHDGQKILFLGDEAMSSGGGIDDHFNGFASRSGRGITAQRRAVDGWDLAAHRRDGGSVSAIRSGYAAVVIQDRALRPVLDRSGSLSDVRSLCADIRNAGAAPVIAIGWPGSDGDGELIALAEASGQSAVETGAGSLPIGLAIGRSGSRRSVGLTDGANRLHTAGSYLAAAVAWDGMVGDVRGIDYVPSGISADLASFLRNIAHESVSLHNDSPRNRVNEVGANGAPLGYLAYEPVGYRVLDDRGFPLVVYLAGLGERGSGYEPQLSEKILVHGPHKQIAGRDGNYPRGRHFPAIVASPNHEDAWRADKLKGFIDHVRSMYRIDPDRIYLTGLSEGGGGVMTYADAHGRDLAAVVPICPSHTPNNQDVFSALPMWLHHNFSDRAVTYERSLDAATFAARGRYGSQVPDIRTSYPHQGGNIGMPAAGDKTAYLVDGQWGFQDGATKPFGDPRAASNDLLCSIYELGGHDAWSRTYANQGVWDWLFAQRRGSASSGPRPKQVGNDRMIEAEDYDGGGQGIAYHDTSGGNSGGKYRSDGVDIEECHDDLGGYSIGWIDDGEWQRYTIEVASAGTYRAYLRVAKSGGSSRIALEVGGARYEATVIDTGGYQRWVDVRLDGVYLPAGLQALVIRHGGGYNFNRIGLVRQSDQTKVGLQSPFGGKAFEIHDAARIQAEAYDFGGEGVAYHDVDGSNRGGKCRQDGVDIEGCADQGYNIGWVAAGEWLEYTVNVVDPGSYLIDLRCARPHAHSGRMRLSIAGREAECSVASTGGWQQWRSVPFPVIDLPAGQTVLRLVAVDGDINLNHMEFWKQSATQTATPLIIDNRDDRVTWNGDWRASTNAPGFYREDYRVAYPEGVQGASLTFSPRLSQGGFYEVSIRHPADQWRSDRIAVDVAHANGVDHQSINATTGGNSWKSLGVYELGTGESSRIVVRTDGSSRWVVADAIMLTPVPVANQ